jgi:dihydrofolate reductase
MAKLIYTATTSLDGYIGDAEGRIDSGAPGEELSRFTNDVLRSIGTYLLGRRMYETMLYWETPPTQSDQPAAVSDFVKIWQAADEIVYSKTLSAVRGARTRLERDFDIDAVRQMKSTAGRDIEVAGPELAAHAIKAGLVDEFHLYVVPIVLGGGKRYFPNDVRLKLELLDERRFGSGAVYLRYGSYVQAM